MKSKVIFQKEKIIIFCICLVVLLAIFFSSTLHDLPIIFNDEFGYWDSAAWIAGYDWSSVSSSIQYYSYGYGIILAILIKLTDSMTQAYHYAIFLNAVWITLSFLVLYKICDRLYQRLKFSSKIFISIAATFYASNITQRNYTWPECFLFFLFCVNVYLVILLCEKITFMKIAAIVVLCVISYMIHQRTIAITLANIVIVFLLLVGKKINKKMIFGLIFLFLILLLIHILIKNSIINFVWNNSESSSVNNMGSQMSKLGFLFSSDGIKIFTLTFLGRIFYLAISSILLCFWAVESIMKNIINNWRMGKVDYLNIFLFCTLFFTIGISTVSMYTSDFSDVSHIVYGRYIDNIMGPFIIIGLYQILKSQKSIKRFFLYGNILFILGLSVSLLWEMKHPKWISDINNAGISVWVSDKEIRVWPSIIIIFLISCFVYYIGHSLLGKRDWCVGGICIILIFIWSLNGNTAKNNFDRENMAIHDSTENCVEVILDLQKKIDENIAIYADQVLEPTGKWVNYSANGIQFLLPKEKIEYIDLNSNVSLLEKEECIVLIPTGYEVSGSLKSIFSTNNYSLYAPEHSKIYKLAMEIMK